MRSRYRRLTDVPPYSYPGQSRDELRASLGMMHRLLRLLMREAARDGDAAKYSSMRNADRTVRRIMFGIPVRKNRFFSWRKR